MYSIKQYDSSHYAVWNDFVHNSRNGTFLFHRDFMEYHADRFEDYSLIVFDGDKPVALLPANRIGNTVHSHQGLTYGGLILTGAIGVEKVEKLFRTLCSFLLNNGIDRLLIKLLPSFYNKEASFELDYILFKYGSTLYRRDMNLAIDYSKSLTIAKSKLKHFRRISGIGLEIRKNNDFRSFWNHVLIPVLSEKHQASPVHSITEIEMLHTRFPQEISQYNVYQGDKIVAGITLFDFGNVIKSQYGAATAEGEKLRALDFVFITLIDKFREKKAFFDMGTVTSNDGKTYNNGMLKQKEELGCRAYSQDFYEVRTGDFVLLDNVLI